MIVVILEVIPTKSGKQTYFDLACQLKTDLIKIDGYISIERFQSLNDEEKFLSLSYWRDEDTVKAWRCHVNHQEAQDVGKHGLLYDYQISVANVVRHYGLSNLRQAPT